MLKDAALVNLCPREASKEELSQQDLVFTMVLDNSLRLIASSTNQN